MAPATRARATCRSSRTSWPAPRPTPTTSAARCCSSASRSTRSCIPTSNIEQMGRTERRAQAMRVRRTIIQGVLDKIKGDHVGKDELRRPGRPVRGQHQELPPAVQALRPARGEPPGRAHARRPCRATAGSCSPGRAPSRPSGPYTLYVRPIPADWSPEQVTRLPRGAQQLLHRLHDGPAGLPGQLRADLLHPQGPLRREEDGRQPGPAQGLAGLRRGDAHRGRLRQLRPAHAAQPAQAPAQDRHRLPDGHECP